MKIDMSIEQTNLKILHEKILENLQGIERLELDDSKGIETSSLISMLVSFKNSYQDKVAEKLDNKSTINMLGKVVVKE